VEDLALDQGGALKAGVGDNILGIVERKVTEISIALAGSYSSHWLVGEGGLRGGEGGGGGDPHGGGIGESNCIIRSLTSRQCDRRHYDDDALCHPNHHRWFFESWWNPYIWPLSALSDADAIEGPSLSLSFGSSRLPPSH